MWIRIRSVQCDQLRAGADTTLGEHARHVVFDGVLGDAEAVRDLTVAMALDREGGDRLLASGESALGEVIPSYKPGVMMTDLSQCLPAFAIEAIREALPAFGRQIARYDHPDAMMTGVETRTSSPVRITRGADLQSPNVERLFPAGEGAGYAGGILSAAIDGIKVAEAVGKSILSS